MKIVFKDTFINRLVIQLDTISLDSPKRAGKFKSDLFIRIKKTPTNLLNFRINLLSSYFSVFHTFEIIQPKKF